MNTLTNHAEQGTFPAFESRADLVRAFYENRWGIKNKSLTRQAWALSGALPDESYPVTEEGEPDPSRFSGRDHFLDYIFHAPVWDPAVVVQEFGKLPVDQMKFTAGLVCRSVVRPSNSRDAAVAAENCCSVALAQVGAGMSDRELRHLDSILLGYIDKMWTAVAATAAPASASL